VRVPTATAISPPEPVRALSVHLVRAAAGMVPLPRWLESHPLSAMSPSARQLAWAVGRHITRNPDHGFVMAERVPASGIGSLWPLYQAAPSLAHIHRAYPRFAALLLEHVQIEIHEGDQSVCLRHVTPPGFRVDRAEEDFRATMQVATWRELHQSRAVGAQFAHFTYPRPRSTEAHERLLGTRALRFSQPHLVLWLPRVRRLLRTDARARFCALASALSLLPIASTAVHDRLLVVANVTGLALVALAVEATPTLRWLQVVMNVRIGLAAVLCLAYSGSLWEHVRLADAPFEQVAQVPAVRAQTLVFVNAPCVYYPLMLRWLRQYRNQPVPQRVRTLASGLVPLEVERADAHTLVVRAAEGLFQPLGQYRARHTRTPEPLSPVFLAQLLNQFPRAHWDYRKGDEVQLSDLSIRVLQATPDGFPSAVAFQFREPLESPRLQFLAWQDRGYVPFALPPPGKRVTLAAAIQR
jgi:hypothetical protein